MGASVKRGRSVRVSEMRGELPVTPELVAEVNHSFRSNVPFIEKPFVPDTLMAIVREVLDRKPAAVHAD